MTDISVWEGSAVLAPMIGEEIIVVDKEIKFNISCRITGIERNYSKPTETKITISNVLKYDTIFKDLVHTVDIVDQLKSVDADTGKPILMAQYVQGKIDAHVASIVGMLDAIEKPEDKYAILFECRIVGHKLFGALALGSSGMLCANQLDAKGAWIWRTAISATGISATEVSTGCLNATIIKAGVLQSLDGGTWINMENGTFSFQNKVKFDGTKFSITLNSGKYLDAKLTEFTVEDGRLSSLISDPKTGLQTQINQTNTVITSTASALDGRISAVKQTADGVYTCIEGIGGLRTQINAVASGLTSKVSRGDVYSIISQSSDEVMVAFNGISDYVQINSRGLTLGNSGSSDYTKVSSQGLLHVGNNGTKKYHYLSYTDYEDISCSDDDYEILCVDLPSMFDKIDDSDISVSVSIQKVYKDGEYVPYWFGGYGYITGGQVKLYAMSAWRKTYYDSSDTANWVDHLGSPVGGRIILRYTLIA